MTAAGAGAGAGAGARALAGTPARARRAALWALGAAVGVAMLWLASRGVDWGAAIRAAAQASLPWLLLAVACNAAIIGVWAALWRAVLPRDETVAYGAMFQVVATTSAVMNTVPMMAGHVTAVGLLVRGAGVRLRSALSVMALDQLGEGAGKVALFAATAAVVAIPAWMTRAVLLVCALVAALGVVLLFAARHRVGAGLDTLRTPARAGKAAVLALAMKGAEAAGIACVMAAAGVELSPAVALLVLSAVSLATILPLTPGNVGPYEAASVAVYRWMGVPAELAITVALLQHAAFLVPAVGTAYVTAALRGAGGRRKRTTEVYDVGARQGLTTSADGDRVTEPGPEPTSFRTALPAE